MQVAALCPFDVGVVRWRAPTPVLTVIVKSTWLFSTSGALVPAPHQEPLAGDVVHGDALAWSSDFAPYKPRADVWVTGHARALSPTPCIPVRVAVGPLNRVAYAMSIGPVLEVPLAPAYLRAAPRGDAPALSLGPAAPWRMRTVHGPLNPVGPDAALVAPLPSDFDFGVFNVAPPEQQLAAVNDDAPIVLEGLGPGGGRIVSALPGVRARVFLVDGTGGPTQELAVACDTVAIDADRLRCVLLHRGATRLVARSEPVMVVVVAEGPSESLEWPIVLNRIFSARRMRAAELEVAPATDAPALPRLHEDSSIGRWGDESTTRVRGGLASTPPSTSATRPLRGPSTSTIRDSNTRVEGPGAVELADEDLQDDADTPASSDDSRATLPPFE